MSEVTRYFTTGTLISCQATRKLYSHATDYVRASDYDAAQSQLAALREELAQRDSFEKERDDLQQRLADAERRNEDQLKLIGGLVEYANNLLIDVNNAWSYAGSTGNPEVHKDQDYAEAVALIAALNKPEEAKS